ncbi:MAG TPA: aldo/keto reductase [Polyangiaceae bacterium]|nr:aldo/keto reductase [Polyangiaceae bacterium]
MQASFRPRRPLGRTGFVATRLGAGDLADRAVPLDACVATLRRALDAGLNVVDTAPGYEDGYSEEIVGAALRGRREGVFVIDKIDHLDRPVAPQLDESLGRLGLPSVDLFVFHAVSTPEAWRRLAAPGGGMAELGEAIARGRARFRGISSHDPGVLREALGSGLCDVVMFPLGPFVDPRYERETLPLARSLGVGTVCFKTFGAGKLLADTEGYQRPLQARPRGKVSSGGPEGAPSRELPHLSVRECVHYTLTLDPDVALLGLSFPNEQDEAFAAAAAFEAPLGEADLEATRRRAAEAVAGKGPCWWNPPQGP